MLIQLPLKLVHIITDEVTSHFFPHHNKTQLIKNEYETLSINYTTLEYPLSFAFIAA